MAKSIAIFVMGLMVYFVGMTPRWEWTFLQEDLSIILLNRGLLTTKLRHALLLKFWKYYSRPLCHWIPLYFKNYSSLVHQRSFLYNDGWYLFYSSTYTRLIRRRYRFSYLPHDSWSGQERLSKRGSVYYMYYMCRVPTRHFFSQSRRLLTKNFWKWSNCKWEMQMLRI